MAATAYGFIGLGNMGGPMALNLAKSGASLAAFDRAGTAARAPAGASVCDSAAGVAGSAPTIFLSLPDGVVVLSVLDEICAAQDRTCTTVIDLSTVGIDAAQAAGARAAAHGIAYVDAPVSGGRSGAVAGTIAVMWAGPAGLLEAHRPALEAMARHVFHVGTEAGQGQALKLLNNFLSATATAATGEALLFGLSQGLDMKTILDVVNVSTGRSHASMDKYVNRVATGSFDSGFDTALMAKDLKLFADAVAAAGTPHRLGAAAAALWRDADAALPGSDHTEIYRYLQRTGRP
jgi:3-hydroxyisobutyrate dehydrogenase-like beta-hydroxyacid dehydrogenase